MVTFDKLILEPVPMRSHLLRLLFPLLILQMSNAVADILIATAGPFTGKNIFRGEQIQHGAEMAVETINARGACWGRNCGW